jgi:hypothetical protein
MNSVFNTKKNNPTYKNEHGIEDGARVEDSVE